MRFVPEVAVRPRPENEPRYVRSYVFTRFAVGVVGVLLPPVLVFLEPALFDGGLWAIGVFLVVYKFLDFSWESLLSSLAGAAAVLVAIFPTERPGDAVTLTPFQVKFGEDTVTTIHYGSAVAFIALLIPIVLFFARDEGQREHRNWQAFHTITAAFILFGAALAGFAGITGGPDKGVLFGEWIAIWAFGASWLSKGAEWKTLFGRRGEPAVVDSPTVPES
jgi:hypothetical protein